MRLISFLLLVVWFLSAAPALALDTIYVVRHADKNGDWPKERALSGLQPLSELGARRALAIGEHLAESGVAAVYTSPTVRTLSTGLPLASRLDCPLVPDMATVRKDEIAGFLHELVTRHADDQAVLIVGHSNTVPLLLMEMQANEDCYERLGFEDSQHGLLSEGYGNLFKVTLEGAGCDRIERMLVEVPEATGR